MKNRVYRVPLLGHHEDLIAALQRRQKEMSKQERRDRCGVVGALSLLTIINSDWMIPTNPLTPAVKVQSCAHLVAGKLWIADKPKMRFEVGINEGVAKTFDATGEATGLSVRVRTFKRKKVTLHTVSLALIPH